MGGRALSHLGVGRITTEQMVEISGRAVDILSELGVGRTMIVPSYTSKPTHGDIDILVTSSQISTSQLISAFSSRGLVVNGGVTSLEFQGVQIDLIETPEEHWDYSVEYFSYNDRGSLIGVTARRLGFRHTHRGLTWPLTVGTTRLSNEFITRDFGVTLDLFGWVVPPVPDTLEDIYRWVASGRYFRPGDFNFDARRAVDRVRDRKRPTYTGFLEWIAQNDPPPGPGTDDQFHQMISERFPRIIEGRQSLMDQYQTQLSSREENRKIFSYQRLSGLVGITPGQVGKFISFLRQSTHSDLSNDHEVIRLYGEFTDEKGRVPLQRGGASRG